MRAETIEKKSCIRFTRADDIKSRRIPTQNEMRQWMLAAADRPVLLDVRFVGEEEGLELNNRFRKGDHATNVLTFDYQSEPIAQADIVICTPVITREAREQNKRFRAHLAHMLVHATLHAQGWDHASDEEAEGMERHEAQILQTLGFPNPYMDRARAH